VFLLWMYFSWYALLFGAAIAATLPRLRATRFSDEVRAGNAFVTALALLRQLLQARQGANAAVGAGVLARGARTDLVDAERLLESLERLGYVRRLSTPRRRGDSSEWTMTCDPATSTLRGAFERFAIDPTNTLLNLDREGVGTVLPDWIERDEWINAPLDRSLLAAAG